MLQFRRLHTSAFQFTMTTPLARAGRAACTPRSLFVRQVATSADRRSRKPLIDLKTDIREKAESLTSSWKGTNASGGTTKNFIGGEFVESKADKWIDVLDPVSLVCAAVTLSYLIRTLTVYANSLDQSPGNYKLRIRCCCRCCLESLFNLEKD